MEKPGTTQNEEKAVSVVPAPKPIDPRTLPQEERKGGLYSVLSVEHPLNKMKKSNVYYDWQDGLRLYNPDKTEHKVFIKTADNIVLYNGMWKDEWLVLDRKNYIETDFFIDDEEVKFDLKGMKVLVTTPEGTVGDAISWFQYAERFQQKTECELYWNSSEWMKDVFGKEYPNITFLQRKEAEERNKEWMAIYRLGLFFDPLTEQNPYEVFNHRYVGLGTGAAYELDVDPSYIPPRVPKMPRDETVPKEKYVTIASQASAQCKRWNNGAGWDTVCKYLKEKGYRVLSIDLNRVEEFKGHINQIPWESEDYTGPHPFLERIRLMQHAEFHIGLSSGLSWLCWCAGTPCVLISGFTMPITEWPNPYRVWNKIGCNGCWNKFPWDGKNFRFCPKDKDFECTRMITPVRVIEVIERLRKDIEDGKVCSYGSSVAKQDGN